MARRDVICLGMLIIVPCLLGMGMFGQPTARQNVPETPKRFDATVEDLDGVTVKITHASYDGELYLPVYRGKGLVTIPFRNIRRIEFGKKQGNRREVTVSFQDETSEVFQIDENVLIVGKIPYGTYQIQAKDIHILKLVQPVSE